MKKDSVKTFKKVGFNKSTGINTFKKCRLRKKYSRYMNFSHEELYSMYGQYDTFVSLEFHPNSESYNKYGESLMGVFKYTLEQREELENKMNLKQVPRSSKKTLFSPSILHSLTDEQKTDLDRYGILNDDIACVCFVNLPRKKSFSQKGEKEIPNQHEIKINLSEKESYELMLGFYKMKLRNGDNLVEIERNSLYALRLYFEPNSIIEEEYNLYINDEEGNVKIDIREKFLKTKWAQEGLSDDEKEEIQSIWKQQWKKREEILKREIQRSNSDWDNLPLSLKMKLMTLACSFEDEVLISWSNPIWWDTERFLHIYVRHTSDLQHGDYKDKTSFQYDLKTTRELIKSVIESISKEIEAEFNANPNKSFKRQGQRAIYYNGNYYKVEIEPSGRLMTFHPYNDDKERGEDN